MTKLDKKIVSTILVIIILLSQFSTVFAIEGGGSVEIEVTKKTLEEYLLTFEGIDTNSNGKLEASEYENIKNLDLYNIDDFTGIQYAKNLKSLKLTNCGFSIFANGYVFENLESLSIINNSMAGIVLGGSIDSSKMPKLKSLEIINQSFTSLDLSKLNYLEFLVLEGVSATSFKLPNIKELKEIIMLPIPYSIDMDLSSCENIDRLSVSQSSNQGFSQIKFPDYLIIGDNCADLDSERSYFHLESEKELVMQVGDILELMPSGKGLSYAIENNDTISRLEDQYSVSIKADKVGKSNVKITDVLGRIHDINVTVAEKNSQSLENTGLTAEILDYNTILKSNGELWRVNSKTTAERIDVNVKNYVSNIVYNVTNQVSFEYWNEVGYKTESVLKNDNTLNIKTSLDQVAENKIHITEELNVSNVKDINKKSYLTTNGDLYNIDVNIYTGKLKTTKVMSDVKKIVNDCIVKNDNTTWASQFGEYTKIADFEIKEQMGMQVIDNDNTLWNIEFIAGSGFGVTKVEENYEGFEKTFNPGLYSYIEDGVVKKGWTEGEGNELLTNVSSFNRDNIITWTDVMVREDGTIWLYSDTKGLVKIDKSTVIENFEESKITEDEFYIRNEKMKSKKIDNKTALTGLSNNTKVNEFINGYNFNLGYNVKVFNIANQELAENALVGTGDKIKLYNGDKVIKEYVAILYGDTNGDGNINAIDALGIIKNKNGKVPFTDICYIEAGRIMAENNSVPSAIDALAIVKHATNKYTINQYK